MICISRLPRRINDYFPKIYAATGHRDWPRSYLDKLRINILRINNDRIFSEIQQSLEMAAKIELN